MYSKQCLRKDDMQKLIIPFIITIIILIQPLFGCTKPSVDLNPLSIATFNIAWLGDGEGKDVIPRAKEHYALIADIINETSADIIALQEIENMQALNQLLVHLPDYTAILGSGGKSQNVGFMYRKSLKVESIGEYLPIAIDPSRNRPGYVVKVKKGNFDCYVMSVHFKSTSRFDSTDEMRIESRRMRRDQSQKAMAWIDSIKSNNIDQDIFIVGDLNDFPKREKEPTLQALTNSSEITFLTSEMKSCKFQNFYVIDHIIASKSAQNRFIKGSERIIDIYSMHSKEVVEKISDHCPIVMQFDVTQPDND
jgi:predicted extracellular nuclease